MVTVTTFLSGSGSGGRNAAGNTLAGEGCNGMSRHPDVCQRVVEVDPVTYQTGRDLLLRIVAMLTRMVVNRSQSGTGSGSGTDRQAGLGRVG